MHLDLTLSFPLAVFVLGYASSRQIADSHNTFVHRVNAAIAAIRAEHCVASRKIKVHLGFSVPLTLTILLLRYASPWQFAYRHDVMLINSINLVAAISAEHIVAIRQT